MLDGWKPVAVDISDGKHSIDDLLVYDEKNKELAYMLSEFSENPALPMPLGIFLDIERSVYEDEMEAQIQNAIEKEGKVGVNELLKGSSSWKME